MRHVLLIVALVAAAGCDDDVTVTDDLGAAADMNICDPSACPAQTTACKINICFDNSCGVMNAAPGTACNDNGGVVCDSNGGCVPMHCSDNLKDADESDVDCGGMLCAGCADGKACHVAGDCMSGDCNAGVCVPRQTGMACSASEQCASGFCVDNTCCESACTGACKACKADLTGGANGTCLTVLDGSNDPRGVCGVNANVCQAGMCTGVPNAPGAVSATSAPSAITLSWTIPTSNNAAIDQFIITGTGGAPIALMPANVCTATTPGSLCSYTVTGLTNCTAYTLAVVAHNVDGNSAAAPAPSTKPAMRPAAPDVPAVMIPTTTAAAANVSWTAPSDNGCAIDGYDVYISSASGGNGGDHNLGVVLMSSFTGLYTCNYPSGTCGLGYTFTVRAHNPGGWSDYSTGTSVTPRVGFVADNVPGIFAAKCTSCHGAGGTAPDLTGAGAYAAAKAENQLIYLCPEGNGTTTCSGHTVVLTSGELADKTLQQWFSDGQLP